MKKVDNTIKIDAKSMIFIEISFSISILNYFFLLRLSKIIQKFRFRYFRMDAGVSGGWTCLRSFGCWLTKNFKFRILEKRKFKHDFGLKFQEK